MDERTKSMLWDHKPSPAKPMPAKTLFDFIRASDGARITCELIFHSESYGWEVRLIERGELWYSHGSFPLKEQAVSWAWRERKAMEG